MTTFAPRHVDIWPWTDWYDASPTPTRQNQATHLGMGRLLGGNTVNNYVTYNVALDAGTWTLTVIDYAGTDLGIVTVYLDATSLGSSDRYSASAGPNKVWQVTGFTVAAAGVYALKFKVESKNASSTAYRFVPQLITLTRTGS